MLGWSKIYSVTVGQFGPHMHVGQTEWTFVFVFCSMSAK